MEPLDKIHRMSRFISREEEERDVQVHSNLQIQLEACVEGFIPRTIGVPAVQIQGTCKKESVKANQNGRSQMTFENTSRHENSEFFF